MKSLKTQLLSIRFLNLGIALFAKIKDSLDRAIAILWDIKNKQQIKTLHPLVQIKARQFIAAARNHGIILGILQRNTSLSAQTKFYAQGGELPNKIVSINNNGEFLYNPEFTIDVVPIVNGQLNWNGNWRIISDIGKDFGWIWTEDLINKTPKTVLANYLLFVGC